ncbi:MAG: acyl carrier protein [Deltaproteobacteria bacterium]|nr:acyl carrier protein [Deltaproteobacteria bacterium]
MNADTLGRVAKCLGEVLAMEPSTIKAEHRLIDDLGAESLDLVELMFLLEQEFGITLAKKDMSLSAQLGLPEDEIHRNEVLTPRALGLLRTRFPGSRSLLVDGVTLKHLAALLTVEEVARAVERKLG